MDFATWQYLLKYSIGKPGAIGAFRNASYNQNLPPDQLNELSWNKTLKLLHLAYANVPWYKELFASINLHPGDIKHPEDFYKIPILTREQVKENFVKFISDKIDPHSLKISTTGGSSGQPLKIGMDPRVNREVPKWQMLSWWGLSPVSNMASIYRGTHSSGLKGLSLNLINWPRKTVRMDATNITETGIKDFIKAYSKYKPRLIHGYVGALDALADYINDNDIILKPPNVVWSTAAPITSIQERKISKAFNAPVCDQYGCSEIYYVAAECSHKKGLHIFSDSVRVEILDDNNMPVKPGQYGKIVLTNLNEYCFPLIRYENGDKGRLLSETCTCGLTLPLMDKIKGRISDNIILPDGTVLSGEYLTTIFDNYTEEIRQFQIIQHKSSAIAVRIVFYRESEKKQYIMRSVESELQKRIKSQVSLNIEVVNSIAEQRGKLQFIIRDQS
jgi:phenylacetate-CoA ligase